MRCLLKALLRLQRRAFELPGLLTWAHLGDILVLLLRRALLLAQALSFSDGPLLLEKERRKRPDEPEEPDDLVECGYFKL